VPLKLKLTTGVETEVDKEAGLPGVPGAPGAAKVEVWD